MVEPKQQRAWDFQEPRAILSEIAKVLPDFRGVDFKGIREAGWQPAEKEAATRRSFAHARQDPRAPDPEYPLTLVVGRSLYDRGTLLSHSDAIGNLIPAAHAVMHPADAEKLGLKDGDEVSVISETGRLGFRLRVSDEVVPGVLCAPRNLTDAPLSVLFSDHWSLPRVRVVK
jgi:predicted molibdopterin-dependent oxidoreductase YjgC